MDITPEIIASFRTRYPQFSDNTKWPDPVLEIALCEADAETGGCRWGAYEDKCNNFKQRGMFAYAAHYLTVTYRGDASDDNNVSAGAKQNVASKSVGDESVSYNVNKGLADLAAGDEWLATTQWGQMYLRLRRRCGMGAIAV